MPRSSPPLNGFYICNSTTTQSDLASLEIALLGYARLNSGVFPTTAQGLDALVNRPSSEPWPADWTKQMDKIPLDPWGSTYVYQFPGTHKTRSGCDISSPGPDRQPNTDDDIVNWQK